MSNNARSAELTVSSDAGFSFHGFSWGEYSEDERGYQEAVLIVNQATQMLSRRTSTRAAFRREWLRRAHAY